MDIKDLVQSSIGFDSLKDDFVAPARTLDFSGRSVVLARASSRYPDNLLFNDDFINFKITDNALRDFCVKLAPAVYGKGTSRSLPFEYLKVIPDELFEQNMRSHVSYANGAQWMYRTYSNGLRAVLGDNYPANKNSSGMFENSQYLYILSEIMENERGVNVNLIRPYISPDSMHVKISWQDVNVKELGYFGVGVYIYHDEVGHGKLKVARFIQRTSCSNSIIFDDENFLSVFHRGSFAAMKTQFYAAIGNALYAQGEIIDRLIEADATHLDNIGDIIGGLARRYGWDTEFTSAVGVGTEGQDTVLGVINGVTYAAHTQIDDITSQIEYEKLGGYLLTRDANYFQRAALEYQTVGVEN